MWESDGHFCNIPQRPSVWKVFPFKKQMRYFPWCNDWSLFFILALCLDRVPNQANPQNLIQQHKSLLSFHHLSFRIILRASCDSELLQMEPQSGEYGWVDGEEGLPAQASKWAFTLSRFHHGFKSDRHGRTLLAHKSTGGVPEPKKKSSFILFCLLISFLKVHIWVKSKYLSFSDLFRSP